MKSYKEVSPAVEYFFRYSIALFIAAFLDNVYTIVTSGQLMKPIGLLYLAVGIASVDVAWFLIRRFRGKKPDHPPSSE